MSNRTKSRSRDRRRPDLDTIYTINPDGSRNFLQVADVRGRWHTITRAFYYLLILVYLGAPWLTVGGRPLIHLDIPGRTAHLLGTTYTNQDFHLVFFLVIGIGLGIFVVTSLFGRIWCGFACPQTVFLEGVFRPIERLVEGGRLERIRRNQGPATFAKVARKAVKHALFLFLSWVFAVTFMAYFIPARELLGLAPFFPGHLTALLWSVFWTAVLYFDYSWFREQTCLIICPYGRLQSTLVDYDTVIIGYDGKRGEPRSKGAETGGDCIDCRRCVDVCPTGIDIRNGLQLECIGCTNCIDACDEIMVKIDKPRGLIRFDSSRSFETGRRRFLRPRLFIYLAVCLALGGLFLQRTSSRQDFQVTVLRPQGLPFAIDGEQLRNLYTMHLQNKTDQRRVYFIAPAEGALAGKTGVSYIIPQPRVELAGLAGLQLTMFAMMPRSSYTAAEDFHFAFTDSATAAAQLVKVRFRGP